jgi:predicted ATPase
MREQHSRQVLDFPMLRPDSQTQEPSKPLPAPLVSLVGRKQERAALGDLLRRPEVRLVTIMGPGGVGKTHLGLQVAADLLDAFADGVYFVPLASISDPELVLSTLINTLGLLESREQSLFERIVAFARGKHLLLLLDNLEQVLAVGPALTALLSVCPHLKLLVTSRAALSVEGEYTYPLAPLAVPNLEQPLVRDELSQVTSVVLFVQRVQAILPAFQLSEENARDVAEICNRLDGLPLALELAAARISLLPPAALLERLEPRLPLLSSMRQDLPMRQKTLRNTIAWSYRLLTEEEQRLFRLLSVFVDGCTLEAAEALAAAFGGSSATTLDKLTSLQNKSLLYRREQEEGEPRLLMLETIREYGLEVLAECGEDELARHAHATYYLALAEEAEPALIGPAQATWLQRLEWEH